MKFQPLWYVRRGDRVTGPFPESWLRRDFALGRLAEEDEISLDRLTWLPVKAHAHWLRAGAPMAAPADLPEWGEERHRARLRWLDERRLLDRRRNAQTEPDREQRRGRERRRPENAQQLLLRQRQEALATSLSARRERFLGVAVALLVVLALVSLALFRLPAVQPLPVALPASSPDCRAPAAPQRNWSGCDKSGAWLKGVDLTSATLAHARLNSARLDLARLPYANLAGADLSFASLNGALLEAANLQGANLAYAEFKQADLRRADLRGALLAATDFSGARLGLALWVDGRQCRPEAVGSCW